MRMRIAVGGSAADPPTYGHVELLRCLLASGRFDLVIWILSGIRLDKDIDITPDQRVVLTLLAIPQEWLLGNQPSFIIKFDDVYGKNTPTIKRLESIQSQYPHAEVVWYTGADSVTPRPDGTCELQHWKRGQELWDGHKFLIVSRQGYPDPATLSLPPQFEVLNVQLPNTSSSGVIDLIRAGKEFEHLVPPKVARYIKNHCLYGYKS
jgi:nicotinate-nucleotide adenylyltransferase